MAKRPPTRAAAEAKRGTKKGLAADAARVATAPAKAARAKTPVVEAAIPKAKAKPAPVKAVPVKTRAAKKPTPVKAAATKAAPTTAPAAKAKAAKPAARGAAKAPKPTTAKAAASKPGKSAPVKSAAATPRTAKANAAPAAPKPRRAKPQAPPTPTLPPYLAAELGQPVDHEGEPIGAGSPAARGDTELQQYTLQLWRQMQSRRGVNLHIPAMERAGVTIDQIWTAGVTDKLTTSSTPDEVRRYKQKLLFRANLLESILSETVSELHRLGTIEPTPSPTASEPG